MRVPQNHWYPVLESREVRRAPLGVERLGMRLVFWRTRDGQLQAQRDRCPHLGAALSAGVVAEDTIVCPFHGFRYDAQGRCRQIPALGLNGDSMPSMSIATFPVREAHGLVWLWWGDPQRASAEPQFFEGLASGWRYHTVRIDWPVHYTRAIENQLDVAHVAFVHRTTIGAGGRSRVDGPHVEADAQRIRIWTTNRRPEDPPKTPQDLVQVAATIEPSLELRFPTLWLLNIGRRFKNVIAFVPINDHTTRYYLRSYRAGSTSKLWWPLDWVLSWANRLVLSQDRRVVVTQTPTNSSDATDDHLLVSDRGVIEFRRLHAQLLRGETQR